MIECLKNPGKNQLNSSQLPKLKKEHSFYVPAIKFIGQKRVGAVGLKVPIIL